MKKILLCAALSVLMVSAGAKAQIPQVIAYQGYLSQGGVAYNSPSGGVPVTLVLYDDQNAGKQVWSQTFTGVTVSNGYYGVNMDFSSNWQNGYTSFDHTYWLSVQVNGQSLTPRVQFTSSPSCFNARIADSAIHIPQAPVGSIMAYGGDIFQLRANEQKLGWYVCDGRRIPVDTFPVYAQVVGSTYGVSNAGDSVYLPDFRCLFLRGVDGGMTGPRSASDSLADPDANIRFAMNPNGTGNSQNQVGSVQDDAFQGHWHNLNKIDIAAGGGGGEMPSVITPGASLNGRTVLDPVSDGLHGIPRTSSETRPKNAYVYWIIKVR